MTQPSVTPTRTAPSTGPLPGSPTGAVTGAPSALSPDAAWMLPPDSFLAEVESAFVPESDAAPASSLARVRPPAYGGLRYTAAWWAARRGAPTLGA